MFKLEAKFHFKSFYSANRKKKRKILFSLFVVSIFVGKMVNRSIRILIVKSKNVTRILFPNVIFSLLPSMKSKL